MQSLSQDVSEAHSQVDCPTSPLTQTSIKITSKLSELEDFPFSEGSSTQSLTSPQTGGEGLDVTPDPSLTSPQTGDEGLDFTPDPSLSNHTLVTPDLSLSHHPLIIDHTETTTLPHPVKSFTSTEMQTSPATKSFPVRVNTPFSQVVIASTPTHVESNKSLGSPGQQPAASMKQVMKCLIVIPAIEYNHKFSYTSDSLCKFRFIA